MSDIGPGDLVVCVDAKPDRIDPLAHLLTEGRVYRVHRAGSRVPDGVPSVAFRALPSNVPGMGWAFNVIRFRKIDAADEQFTRTVRACKPCKELIG
jgi:hypothetical protein